jgi:hypothetical protein
MSEVEKVAARGVMAYLQLLGDLANASATNCQAFADQVTIDNLFRLDAKNGLVLGATSSLRKASETVPDAYAKYWKALSA